MLARLAQWGKCYRYVINIMAMYYDMVAIHRSFKCIFSTNLHYTAKLYFILYDLKQIKDYESPSWYHRSMVTEKQKKSYILDCMTVRHFLLGGN